MRRVLLALLVLTTALGGVIPAAAATQEPPSRELLGIWHRVPQPDTHEMRTFHRQGDQWVGLFKHQHLPGLEGSTPHFNSLGGFRGEEVETHDCWLAECPEDIVFAVLGTSTFTDLDVATLMAVTESGVLWWVADFSGFYAGVDFSLACPWYRDADDSVAANPLGEFDCIEGVDFGPDGVIDIAFHPPELMCSDGYDNDGDGYLDEADSDC